MRLAAVLGLAGAIVAGCATAPPRGAIAPVETEARRAALQAQEHWRLSGRVAVTAAGEGATAAVDWSQAAGTSEVELRGPFGAGALRVSLTGENLSLEDGESRLEGEAARQYLEARLGAKLPVAELRYWVLGVPAPWAPFEETAGVGGLPERLVQQGWSVSFERYRPVDGQQLPSRITAEAAGTRVKLAVVRWELAP